MTTLCFLRAKDGSVVLGADSRISAGSGITNDNFIKLHRIDNILVGFAGNLGPFTDTLRRWELEEITTIGECAVLRHGSGWTALLYDIKTAECSLLDADGALVPCEGYSTAGSGGDVAYGYLRAFKQPAGSRGSKGAQSLVIGALTAASERDAATGKVFELLCVGPTGRVTRVSANA